MKRVNRLQGFVLVSYLLLCMLCASANADTLKIKVNEKGQIGYVNSDGVEVIKCQYKSGTPFKDGMAIVGKGDKYGMIGEDGKVVLPIAYNSISAWNNEGMQILQKGKKYGLVDAMGNIVLPLKYSSIGKLNCYGKAWISMGGTMLKDSDGKLHVMNAKWGIIDKNGSVVIDVIYKGLFEFAFDATNIFPMYEGKRLAYSNHYVSDTLVTDCEFMGYNKKRASIWKSGLLDSEGNVLVAENKYTVIMKPAYGMMRYYNEDKKQTVCGYHDIVRQKNIDLVSFDGKFAELKLWSHGDFVGDIACVNSQNGWALVNKDGNSVKSGYSKIKYSNNCKLWSAWDGNGQCFIIDGKGNSLDAFAGITDVNFRYTEIEPLLFSVCKNGKWGVVDMEGNIIIPYEYDYMLGVKNEDFMCKKDGKWGMIKSNGDSLVPHMFSDIIINDIKDPDNVWVMKSDSLYYNYDVVNQHLGNEGFRKVTNFKDGLAWVNPPKMELQNNVINKAQADIKDDSIMTKQHLFGYILRKDNSFVFTEPLYIYYAETVMETIKKQDDSMLTQSQMKKILLDITRTRRSYPMDVIGEENWDY